MFTCWEGQSFPKVEWNASNCMGYSWNERQGVVSTLQLHVWTWRSLLTLVPSCFIVGLQPRKKTHLLLLRRKHIGFCLQTRKSVIKKSPTSISVAQIPEKKKEVPSATPTEIELQDFFGKNKQAILSLVHPYNQRQSKIFTLKLWANCINLSAYRWTTGNFLQNRKSWHLPSVFPNKRLLNLLLVNNLIHVCGFAFELDITASKMHSILHTNSDMQSVSLIKSICYPESYRFSTEATNWGCQHEKLALDAYRVMKENQHFSYCRLWVLYFDRLPIYWGITRFFNSVRLLWWGMCWSEVSLLQTKWHSWRSIELWTKVLYPVGKSLNLPPILCPNSNTDECLQQKILWLFLVDQEGLLLSTSYARQGHLEDICWESRISF